MNKRVVVDTNVLVSLLDSRDVHHSRAAALVSALENERREFIIPDCVLNEVYTVIARRCLEKGYPFSGVVEEIKVGLERLPVLRAYNLVPKKHDEVIEIMVRTNGRLNYHDALISIAMRENGIKAVATFDTDFEEIDWVDVVDVNGV